MMCLLLHLFGHHHQGSPQAPSADGRRSGGGSPRDILDRRYAAGDIARDDYLDIRRALESPWNEKRRISTSFTNHHRSGG